MLEILVHSKLQQSRCSFMQSDNVNEHAKEIFQIKSNNHSKKKKLAIRDDSMGSTPQWIAVNFHAAWIYIGGNRFLHFLRLSQTRNQFCLVHMPNANLENYLFGCGHFGGRVISDRSSQISSPTVCNKMEINLTIYCRIETNVDNANAHAPKTRCFNANPNEVTINSRHAMHSFDAVQITFVRAAKTNFVDFKQKNQLIKDCTLSTGIQVRFQMVILRAMPFHNLLVVFGKITMISHRNLKHLHAQIWFIHS